MSSTTRSRKLLGNGVADTEKRKGNRRHGEHVDRCPEENVDSVMFDGVTPSERQILNGSKMLISRHPTLPGPAHSAGS